MEIQKEFWGKQMIEPFSQLEYSFQNFIKESEKDKQLATLKPSEPFSDKEKAEGKDRVKKAVKDFWFFDKTYFPENIYDNYAEPNRMLKKIVKVSTQPGYHLFLGPREHGKTITAKKLFLWLTLSGKVNIAGAYSETLTKSAAILKDLYLIANNNDKLLYDFQIEFHEANSDYLSFTSKLGSKIYRRFIASFSEGRSVKGYTRLFGRPTFLLGDDIETIESSFSSQSVQNRIDKLSESYHSMTDNSTFIILGNDFKNTSAMHQLRLQFEQNLLPQNFHVHIFKAWYSTKPLWHTRYKAKSESELKKIINPLSESDWQANFQQNPIPPEGFYFLRKHYQESVCPKDARGVIYCDPNLAKKGRGNTTAILPLFYSAKLDSYFVSNAICKSYSDSNQLLRDLLQIKLSYSSLVAAIGFDGHVTQESTWTQHIKNYCKIQKIPYPVVEYKKYRVDDLAKNLQLIYDEGKLFFPIGFSKSENGERFLSQFFAFSGKKDNKEDDAPDAVICAFEFIHERRIVRRTEQVFKTFKDYYQL